MSASPPDPSPTALAYQSAARHLLDCGDALDEAFGEWESADVAMESLEGAGLDAYDAACRLSAAERAYQQAIVDHARALAELAILQKDALAAILAHLEAGR